MDKFKVVEKSATEITFSSIADMEIAYNLLADGRDIVLYMEEDHEKNGEILPGKVFSDIMDGKVKLTSSEKM